MPYELPALPYAYDSLEPYLSAEIVYHHHTRRHAAYVTHLNEFEAAVQDSWQSGDFVAIRALLDAMNMNLAGHTLHSVYWTNMAPRCAAGMPAALDEAIIASFGSRDRLVSEFAAAANAVQGCGWAALAWHSLDQRLIVLQIPKHERIPRLRATPIMVLDMWEHAYAPQYRGRRRDFVTGYLDIVNWDDAAARLEAARASAPAPNLPATAVRPSASTVFAELALA